MKIGTFCCRILWFSLDCRAQTRPIFERVCRVRSHTRKPSARVTIAHATTRPAWSFSQVRLEGSGSTIPGNETKKVKKIRPALNIAPGRKERGSDCAFSTRFPRIHIPERGVCISSTVDAISAVVREWCPCSFVTRTMPIMSPPVAKNKASATRNELKTLSGILAEG